MRETSSAASANITSRIVSLQTLVLVRSMPRLNNASSENAQTCRPTSSQSMLYFTSSKKSPRTLDHGHTPVNQIVMEMERKMNCQVA